MGGGRDAEGKMKKGEKRIIYNHDISGNSVFEGEAVLIKEISPGNWEYPRWEVLFSGDTEPVERFLYPAPDEN
jgi:hypothetical protein